MNPRNNKENYALYAKTYEIFGNNIRNISCFSYSFLRSLIFWRNYIFYLFSVSHHFNDKERNKEWRKLLIYLIYDKCPKIINQLNLNMFLNTFFFLFLLHNDDNLKDKENLFTRISVKRYWLLHICKQLIN